MLRLSAFAPLPLLRLALTAGVLGLSPLLPASADEVLDWNVTGFEAAMAGGQNNVVVSRTMAMMHLAIHDALNAIDRRYQPYLYEERAEPSAAPAAAVAAAARDVLVGVIPAWGKPEQRTKALTLVETAYAADLGKLPEGQSKQQGIAIGQKVVAAMLAARKADGASAVVQYTPGTAPGKWRSHPNPVPANPPIADPVLAAGNWPALLPHWGQITPF